MTPAFTTGVDLFGSWLADMERGDPPVRYTLPDPFGALDLRPGRLILFGGPPGGGKTAAILQIGIELLRANPAARLLVANVEMVPKLLMDRLVSRIAAVPLTAITDHTLSANELERVRKIVDAIKLVADRLAFLDPPFSLEHVAAAGTAFGANALALDYLQRFTVGDGQGDKREQLEAAAAVLRRFCDEGAAVLAVAAVARQKSESGSTYKGLNLASFRGSSELEYGADAAYMLVPIKGGTINFQCEKNRFGPVADIATVFDPITQSFTPAPSGLEAFNATPPAPMKGKKPKGG